MTITHAVECREKRLSVHSQSIRGRGKKCRDFILSHDIVDMELNKHNSSVTTQATLAINFSIAGH